MDECNFNPSYYLLFLPLSSLTLILHSLIHISLLQFFSFSSAIAWIEKHKHQSLIEVYLAHLRSSPKGSIVFLDEDLRNKLQETLSGPQLAPLDLQASPININEANILQQATEMLDGSCDENAGFSVSLNHRIPQPVDVNDILIDSNECQEEAQMDEELEEEAEKAGVPPQEVEKLTEDIELNKSTPYSHDPIGIASEGGEEVDLSTQAALLSSGEIIPQAGLLFAQGGALSSPDQWEDSPEVATHDHHRSHISTHTHHSTMGASALASPPPTLYSTEDSLNTPYTTSTSFPLESPHRQ